MLRLAYLCGLVMVVTACAQEPQRDTVEICRGNDCRVQDRSVATFDPSANLPNDDPEGKVALLSAQAEQDPRAAFDLGMRLFRGEPGIPRNSYQALQWLRQAAERGDERAQLAVGRLYLTGLEEMGSDLREAESFLLMASAQGNEEATQLLDELQPVLADQRAYDQARTRWLTQTRYYWYRAPWYYYRWDAGRRGYYPYF